MQKSETLANTPNTQTPMVFLKFNQNTFKLPLSTLHQSLLPFISSSLPGKKFPEETTLKIARSGKSFPLFSPGAAFPQAVSPGDIVSIRPPRAKAAAADKRPLVFLRGALGGKSIETLREALGLDEGTAERNFLFDERFGLDGFSRGAFVELPSERAVSRVLERGCGEIEVVKPEKALVRCYAKMKKMLTVVLLEEMPEEATSADLRIFFALIPIFSVHLIDSQTAFLEIEEEHLNSLLKYNGELFVGHRIRLKESSHEKLLQRIREKNKNRILEGSSPKNGPKRVDENSERKQTFNYENKDFKCVVVSGLQSNSCELDIARFFDESQTQPLLIHMKKDGTAAYCEFNSVRDADRAITLDKQNYSNNPVAVKRVRYSEIAKLKNSQYNEFLIDTKNLDSYRVDDSESHQTPPNAIPMKSESQKMENPSSSLVKEYSPESPEKVNNDNNPTIPHGANQTKYLPQESFAPQQFYGQPTQSFSNPLPPSRPQPADPQAFYRPQNTANQQSNFFQSFPDAQNRHPNAGDM